MEGRTELIPFYRSLTMQVAVRYFRLLFALARYGSDVDWGSARAWAYVIVVAAVLTTGVAGWVTARRALVTAPMPAASVT